MAKWLGQLEMLEHGAFNFNLMLLKTRVKGYGALHSTDFKSFVGNIAGVRRSGKFMAVHLKFLVPS